MKFLKVRMVRRVLGYAKSIYLLRGRRDLYIHDFKSSYDYSNNGRLAVGVVLEGSSRMRSLSLAIVSACCPSTLI